MHSDLNDKTKNRGLSVGKAFVKTYCKDLAVTAIPTYATTIGLSALTGNPLLSLSVGSLVAQGTQFGLAGSRIYNTAKNK